MHFKLIACEVMVREFCHALAHSTNTIDIEFFTQGLHDNSDVCRSQLQERIDAPEFEKYDAVLLGYGLCNNAMAGIRAGNVKTVIPRAHDCITLLLGSAQRYAEEFENHPGTYYYSAGWLEYPERGGERVEYSQKSGLAERLAKKQLIEKYGEENAEYISEIMNAWEVHYSRGAYIEFPFTRHLKYRDEARKVCEEKGWEFAVIDGDMTLFQDLLDGRWDADRFLVLEPGQSVKPDYSSDSVFCAEGGCCSA